MRYLVIVAGVWAASCGRSECEDLTVVWCQKAVTCRLLLAAHESTCEAEARRALAANRVTEDQCRDLRRALPGMSCAEFRALLEQ